MTPSETLSKFAKTADGVTMWPGMRVYVVREGDRAVTERTVKSVSSRLFIGDYFSALRGGSEEVEFLAKAFYSTIEAAQRAAQEKR